MQRVALRVEHSPALSSDLDRLYDATMDGGWKLSGCGLSRGAMSSALFLNEYAASKNLDLGSEIQELFDRGCNSVVAGKTCWLDFADLVLVSQKLSSQEFIEIEPGHFFEDIDKLALAAMAEASNVSGFENSDLGAGLYALRRYKAGAPQFSEALRLFAFKVTSVAQAPVGKGERCNLRYGLPASLLFLSAVVEIGLAELNPLCVARLIDGVCNYVNAQNTTTTNSGFHTGDLGIGYAVLRAGMVFRQDEWINAGLQILVDSARDVLDCGIGSLDLDSGAVGVALVFHKLYSMTGYGIFREVAARARWLSSSAGFTLPGLDIDREYSFYHGVSGIGLATLFWQKSQSEKLDEFVWLL